MTESVNFVARRGRLSERQRAVLLQGISTERVSKRAAEKGSRVQLSYLEQADVRAHADRVFGHGNWDCETIDCTQVFEEQNAEGRWNVGYRVTMQVTIYNPDGLPVCRYSETAAGTPMGPMKDRGDAHDMAIKTAASDAMKRCFINLGDQFGLSLYWKGRTAPVVLQTLVDGEGLPESVPAVPVDEEAGPESGPPPTEDPAAGTTDSGPPTVADSAFTSALDEVRVAAVVPDSNLRLMALAQIRQRTSQAVLDRTTSVKGATITLGALIDRASTGEFVPKDAVNA